MNALALTRGRTYCILCAPSRDAMKAIAEAQTQASNETLRRNRSNFGHAYAVFLRFYVVLLRILSDFLPLR